MPLTYSIHSNLNLISRRASGVLTLDEITRVNAELGSCSQKVQFMDVFDDLRDITDIELNFNRVASICTSTSNFYRKSTRCTKMAIYAPCDLCFGMSRMFHSMICDVGGLDVGVFRNLDEAADFLSLDDTAVRMLDYRTDASDTRH